MDAGLEIELVAVDAGAVVDVAVLAVIVDCVPVLVGGSPGMVVATISVVEGVSAVDGSAVPVAFVAAVIHVVAGGK